ncbi:hypothetical protein BTUL_0034g00100 [Botrytis tulipae]|uniref:Uncharacterized protein n=1 Tax=Botrytis tulipae TaxID=87230 RepID=A0A4Z1EWV8_9HELO|nr:hypothetical protein BTUL_0034g00100 [Botrytis tulipae]
MASNISFTGLLTKVFSPETARLQIILKKTVQKVDEIDLKIQMKDMEIKMFNMNKMEMKVDDLEGKVDEKLTRERLDYQTEMLDWKAQAQKEKNDLEVKVLKLKDKFDRREQLLNQLFVYKPWRQEQI